MQTSHVSIDYGESLITIKGPTDTRFVRQAIGGHDIIAHDKDGDAHCIEFPTAGRVSEVRSVYRKLVRIFVKAGYDVRYDDNLIRTPEIGFNTPFACLATIH
jgi:hypothetical protein